MVYQQFITQKHWSLAWYFRDYGYSVTAIHPYYDWFWKRNSVYPLLGFENIYFNDGNLSHTDIKGRYISDKAVSDEIISKYEMFSENGERPVFTFAVTMQNHGPYYAWYAGDDATIKLQNQLDKQPADIAETYAEGARYASEAFVYLTEYFKNEKRPTYIIMFGDHAPSPVADMAEYYAIGENGEITEEVVYRKYTTPLIVWTNDESPETEKKIRDIKTVTPQMLTGEIFNITGMPKPPYIEMLENIKKTTRGFNSRYILDANGIRRPAKDFESLGDIYEKLRIVQYDATLGKKYFADEFAESAKK
jgi:phosphoglycerol transferase MdoB-like AlkP superfamily enzyme